MGQEQLILDLVKRAEKRLAAVTEPEASRKPAPDKWSKKEILGHLIDSASNNHQRFVRAQIEGALSFPGYAQVDWVRVQDHAGADWKLLRELWRALNVHLAHIIEKMPAEKKKIMCRIGEREAVTLEALIADYVRHAEHHLKQIDAGF